MTEIVRIEGGHSLANGAAEVQIEHHNALRMLGALPPSTFAEMVDEMALGRQRILQVMQRLMVVDIHYGKIPGTLKPTLFKPGAELLCSVFGLIPEPEVFETIGDGETQPDISIRVTCRLRHVGSGAIAAVGVGSANSWEVRYRYRMGQKTCPQCQASGSLMRSKYDSQPWVCLHQKGGCGAKFAGNDRAITGQLGRAENPDPYDLGNTLLKMSKKRALVDSIISATAASDLWTQDHEDDVKRVPVAPAEPNRPPAAAPQKQAQAQATKPTPTRATAPADEPPPPDEAPPAAEGGVKGRRQELLEFYTNVAKASGEKPSPAKLDELAVRVLRDLGHELPHGARLSSLTDEQCVLVRKHLAHSGVD